MERWRSVLALAVAGALLASPALAQTSGGTRPQTGSEQSKPGDTTKSDAAKSDAMKSGAAAGNREQVQSVQQALKDKGHDPGQIDGVMGPKTKAALKEFQKAEGLKETGRLDAETTAKLGVDSAAAASPRGTSEPSASPGSSTGPAPSSKDPTGPTKKPQTR